MKNKNLNVKGEIDYDYGNDILFFKAKDREYSKSIELNNLVVDVDSEDFIVGLQIFEASHYFNLSKDALMKVPKWQLHALVNDKIIEIRLVFQVIIRNRIIEKNPIITQQLEEPLPNSELLCIAK